MSESGWKEISEEDLIQHICRQGPDAGEAFGEYYERIRQMLVSILTGRGCPDPEDAAQQAFLNAWVALPRFDARNSSDMSKSFRAWILRIAENTRQNQLRSAAYRLRSDISPEKYAQLPDSKSTTPLEKLEDRERDKRLHKCLNELSPDEREAFLEQASGLGMRTSADMHEATVGAIKNRRARARDKLRECVQRGEA